MQVAWVWDDRLPPRLGHRDYMWLAGHKKAGHIVPWFPSVNSLYLCMCNQSQRMECPHHCMQQPHLLHTTSLLAWFSESAVCRDIWTTPPILPCQSGIRWFFWWVRRRVCWVDPSHFYFYSMGSMLAFSNWVHLEARQTSLTIRWGSSPTPPPPPPHPPEPKTH
jgi:hypothetical protein